jgi:hypothetical protein
MAKICPNLSDNATVANMNKVLAALNEQPFTERELDLLKFNKEQFKLEVSNERLQATYAAYNYNSINVRDTPTPENISMNKKFNSELGNSLQETLARLYPQIKLKFGKPASRYSNTAHNLFIQYNITPLGFVNGIDQYTLPQLNNALGPLREAFIFKLSKNNSAYLTHRGSIATLAKLKQYIKDNDNIIGEADIAAMSVLIDSVNQQQDTLPHEYAHHYIAWYKDTPIVQRAIELWGSEEKLVQAIGEQAVFQKGEAWSWWNRFTQFIYELLGKDQIKNALTDAFLRGVELAATKNLSPAVYNQTKTKLLSPVAKTVSNINLRITNLKAFNTRNTDPAIARLVNIRIESLREDVANLVDGVYGNSPSALAHVATSQLNRAKAILLSEFISGDDLIYASGIVNSWKFENSKSFMTEEILNNPDSEFYKVFKDISSMATDVEVILNRSLFSFADNIRNKKLGDNKSSGKVNETTDTNMLTAMLLSASMSNNDITKIIDSMLKLAKNNQKPAVFRITDQINKMFEPLESDKQLAKIVGKNYEIFWQKDETGELTGRATTLFSSKWDRTLDAFDNELKKNEYKYRVTGEISSDQYYINRKDIYDRQRKTNLIVDYRFLMPGSTFKSTLPGYNFKNATEYREHLVKVLGVELAEEFEQSAKAKHTEYLNDREAEFQLIDNDDTITDKKRAKLIWEYTYDPIKVLNARYGDSEKIEGYITSDKYLLRVPRKYDSGGIETGFYDKSFDLIKNNSKLYTFYKQYGELMESLKDMLPINVSEDLPSNFLAAVHKEMIEQLASGEFKDYAGTVANEMFNFYTADEVAELNSRPESVRILRDPVTGLPQKLPPVKYTGQFNKSKHSMDLKKIATLFAKQAINYDYMIKVRNTIEALYSIAEQGVTPELSDRSMKPTIGVNNETNLIKQGKGAKTQVEWLRFTIDALLYNERTVKPKASNKVMYGVGQKAAIDDLTKTIEDIHTETFGKPFKFKDKIKKYEMAKEIELLRDELDYRLDLDLMEAQSDEERDVINEVYKSKMKVLEEKYKQLGGNRLVYSNIGEFLITVTQLKGMGFNVTAGISNLLFGVSSVINHASGNIEYGNLNLLKATKLMIKSFSKPNSKYYNIIKKLDILFEQRDSSYKDGGKSVTRKLSAIDPYVIQNRTEYINQSLPVIAMMIKRKITLANGEVVSLYDVFGEDGDINLELLSDADKTNWTNDLDATTENEYTKFRDAAIQLNTYLHGNYDPQSPIWIKKYMLGRMLLMFRSWVPMGFASRFMDERYDTQLGRKIKGRWVTYWDLGFRQSISGLIKRIMLNDESFAKAMKAEGISDVDSENIKRNLSELILVTAMNLMMYGLKRAIDDDDEDKDIKDYITQVLVNQIHRAEQDVWFYMNPITFYEIIKDPLPVSKTITDLMKAVEGTYKYYTKDDYRGQPPYIKWAKVFPFTNQIPKVQWLATTDITK